MFVSGAFFPPPFSLLSRCGDPFIVGRPMSEWTAIGRVDGAQAMLRTALFGTVLSAGLTMLAVPEALAECFYDLNGVGYGVNCPYLGGRNRSAAPQPQGPSPEQLRQQREAKDLDEATQDAWDKGAKSYHAGDWAGAIKYFGEALSYDPDNVALKHNLQMAEQHQNEAIAAQQHANDSAAAHQLRSLAVQSGSVSALASGGANANDATTGDQSRVGFDRSGREAGGIAVDISAPGPQSGDPIVPPGKRTPAISAFEAKRDKDRSEIAALDVRIKALGPAANAVELARLKQKRTTAEHQIHYLNFEIGEAITGPKK